MTGTETPFSTATATPAYQYWVHLELFDSSGHRVRDLGSLPSTDGPSNLLSSVGTLFADGSATVQFRDAGAGWTLAWNGEVADGSFASPGVYLLRATYSAYTGGALSIKETSLTVVPVADQLGSGLIAVPNPADGSRPMELRWIPSSRAALVTGRVYNLAGELVFLKAVDASTGNLNWGLRSPSGMAISDGVYVWDVEVRDTNNRVIERIRRKVVVLKR
jgi:hypothetical protein